MITASIVTYNTNLEELKNCLESLNPELIKTIYVIDNSSLKEIENFCKDYSKVNYFSSKNVGYGAAHNIAIRKSIDQKSDYHLVINSDVYFDKGVIESIVQYMDENLDVGQLIPNVIYPDGRIQYVCRMLPNPFNLIFRRFLPSFFVKRMDYKYLLKFNDHKEPINVPYHQGSFMFFRVKYLEKIGLFDERFFMYPEDIDITRRMYMHYRTMFWPEVTIVHAHRAESYRNTRMLKIHIENMIKYFNKWGWFFDCERKTINKNLLKELGYNKKSK